MNDFEFTTLDQIKLNTGEVLVLPCTVNYCQVNNNEEAIKIINYLEPILNNSKAFIGIDIETNGLDPFVSDILSLQLGTSKNEQFIFNIHNIDNEIIRNLLLKPFCKLGHNLKFDAKFLNYKYNCKLENLFDTFVAEKLLYLGNQNRIPLSLDAVTKRRLGRELKFIGNELGHSHTDSEDKAENAKKRMQRSFENLKPGDQLSEAQLAYASQDVAALTIFEIAKQQYTELKKEGPNIIFNEDYYNKLTSENLRKQYIETFPPTLSLWPTAVLEFKFLEVIIDMELQGVSFDLDRHEEVLTNLKNDHKYLKNKVLKLLSPFTAQKTLLGSAAINLESPEQLLKALKTLGLTGITSTDAMELENLEISLKLILGMKNITEKEVKDCTCKIQVLSNLSKYRKISKLVSAFGTSLSLLVHNITKKLHPNINQMVDTGRISVNNPNIQQIPRSIPWASKNDVITLEETSEFEDRYGLRECFIAKPGYKLVILDYSAQELCIAACVSQDPDMVYAINDDKDLHCYTVSIMEKVSYDYVINKCKVEKDNIWIQKRTGAKTASFGSLYGSSAHNLVQQLRLTSVEEAQDILNKYWEAYPLLAKAMPLFAKKSHKNLYSNTVLGRRRLYSEPYRYIRHIKSLNVQALNEEAKKNYDYLLPVTMDNIDNVKERICKSINRRIDRQSGNHVIQGTAGDMLKTAAVYVFNDFKLKNLNARIVALVHDEMIIEVIDNEAERCKEVVEENMLKAFNRYCPFVKGKVEGKISDYWLK